MRTLSPRESRMLALALLLAVVVVSNLVVFQPLFGGFADRARQRNTLLLRYAANDRIIAAIPRLSHQAAVRDRQNARYTLAATDRAAAVEVLRDRMQAAANAVGAEFHGGEDVSAAPGTAAMRVAMRVPAGKLAPLLAGIENTTPLLTITGLAVSADDALVTSTASSLDVKLDIAIALHPAPAR